METVYEISETQIKTIDEALRDLMITHPPVPGLKPVDVDVMVEYAKESLLESLRIYESSFQFRLYYDDNTTSLMVTVLTSPEDTDSWQDNRWMRDISSGGRCFTSRPVMI